ncbi:MAG: hypothetical protein AAFR53_05935 [Pseudomonadota bacterium]
MPQACALAFGCHARIFAPMDNEPLQFPIDEDAAARLKTRPKRRWGRPDTGAAVTHPQAERMARIREDEKRRAMPERLMLFVLWAVAILTVAPVALLAFVGY